jgi:RHS repeat-associated protein
MRNVSSGTIYYYAEDLLGSSRTMVQAGATSVCFDADFYPFGGERDVTASCTQSYKFEGKERDSETQNDDFGARYYSWRVGRWLSADWSAVPAPVPYANLTNPQTLNLYAMVSDNPETFADLDGHCPECLDEVEEVAESPEGQEVIGSAEGLAKEFGQDVIESAQEDWSAYKGLAGWLQAGITAVALSLKGDNLPPAPPALKPPPFTASPNAEHKSNERESTRGPHEKGRRRSKMDKGKEKGDKRRREKGMFPRKRPNKYQGAWPPKPPTPPEPQPPPPPRPPEPPK